MGETKAVDGVDLSLAAGEIVTILGHNGSGKTTFLECVEGLRKPDAGTVTLCGKCTPMVPHYLKNWAFRCSKNSCHPRIKRSARRSASSRAFMALTATLRPDANMTIETIAGKALYDYASSGGQDRRVSLVLTFMGDRESSSSTN